MSLPLVNYHSYEHYVSDLARNEKFYCEACREEFARAKAFEAETHAEPREVRWAPQGTALQGVVSHKRLDKNYGFIRVEGCGEWDGPEYFFHEADFEGVTFNELSEGERVAFEVKSEPPAGKAPPARGVHRLGRPVHGGAGR